MTAWPCRFRRRSRSEVEAAIEQLPAISVVAQLDVGTRTTRTTSSGFSYVPIDPCQGVIAALRTAIGERIAREFIDWRRLDSRPITGRFPDPYALKQVTPERFCRGALWPAVPPPQPASTPDRVAWMAARLRELEVPIPPILFVCSILDWPWIRDAYPRSVGAAGARAILRAGGRRSASIPGLCSSCSASCPYITGLYERGRRELTPDDNLSVDGVKELVLDARDRSEETASQDRPADHAAIAFGLLSIYPQPFACGSPAHARPLLR